MTPAEAAKLLEVSTDATPEQLEARFLDLRRKLEDKIAKAPTPGLQAKYRESLATITTAFEILTLAADSSALPVLQREKGEGSTAQGRSSGPAASSSVPSPSSLPRSPAPRAKAGGGREFLIVAVIAVAVLGAGGWWVMKTRAEAAEKTRLEAVAKTEAEQKIIAEKAEQARQAEASRVAAETARREAEAKRQAEAQEKVRLEAEAKAELQRRDQAIALLRARLAQLNVSSEVFFRDEPAKAVRRLSELRSEQRNSSGGDSGASLKLRLQIEAQQAYVDELELLARHPARSTQAKATELVSAQAIDLATEAVDLLAKQLDEVDAQLREAQRRTQQAIYGTLGIVCPYPDVRWTFKDAFGEVTTGQSDQTIKEAGIGSGTIEFTRPGWPSIRNTVVIRRSQIATVTPSFLPARLSLGPGPAGATYRLSNGATGTLPANIEVVPGPCTVTVSVKSHDDWVRQLDLKNGEVMSLQPEPELSPLWTEMEAAYVSRTCEAAVRGVVSYGHQTISLSPSDSQAVVALVSSAMPLSLSSARLADPNARFLRTAGAPLPLLEGSWKKNRWTAGLHIEALGNITPLQFTIRENCGGLVCLIAVFNVQNGSWTLAPTVYSTSNPELAGLVQTWASSIKVQLAGAVPNPAYINYRVVIVVKFHAP